MICSTFHSDAQLFNASFNLLVPQLVQRGNAAVIESEANQYEVEIVHHRRSHKVEIVTSRVAIDNEARISHLRKRLARAHSNTWNDRWRGH